MTARADAHDAGARHQRQLARRGVRKAMGSYYTPPDVVAGLLDLALDPLLAERSAQGPAAVRALRVLDPACGSGNVLLATADRIADALVALGESEAEARTHAFGRAVVGVDLDPGAVRLCRAALRTAGGSGVVVADTTRQVRGADALLLPVDGPGPSWNRLQRTVQAEGGFDLVVGNPPFLNQLESGTARAADHARALRERFGAAVASYTDPAALFLLLAHERARADGGVVALIEPLSLLSTRDAGPVRRAVLADAGVRHLWVAGEQVFDASVLVCAPVLVRGAPVARTALVRGRGFEAAGDGPAPVAGELTWSGLLAALHGLPERRLRTAGVLADVASATADFRDQYYGLAPHVVDQEHGDDEWPRLVTAGLIDPARTAWGRIDTTFNKSRYRHPRVDLAALAPPLQAWATQRLVPKVVVATQTRVLEAVVDDEGRWLPSVPVVTVVPTGDDVGRWHVGALLSAPPTTLVAARRHLGAARHGDALKLGAKDLLGLPLPADRVAWDEAAVAFEQASRAAIAADDEGHRAGLLASATAMLAAFGLEGDQELMAWWEARLPRPRSTPNPTRPRSTPNPNRT